MKTSQKLSLFAAILTAGCGGGQAAVPVEPDPVLPDEPDVVPADPDEQVIIGPTHGMDASCEKDDECIATTDAGNCGCCNCDDLLISSKKSYGWLMDEYAKEQCDDSWCVTVDCEDCPPPPDLGPAVCHEGTCGMIAPEDTPPGSSWRDLPVTRLRPGSSSARRPHRARRRPRARPCAAWPGGG
ncbi:MAG: hypothetical protein JRG91_16825 [Deltaproteobacteria bacterium]|nr:hypothetical protein [Deltaproteobacteria bacterium]